MTAPGAVGRAHARTSLGDWTLRISGAVERPAAPARLLVPHLCLWKSATWIRELELRDEDAPGFGERYGYHNYGDPWQEQRYSGD
jgi:DMSO/TMAO reductase YedYZ molybdopterin-dependent catalytic subunit